jgi:predicted nucleotidyltransferase
MNDDRPKKLQDNLDRILTALKISYQPQEVILFGSLVSGEITEDSDLNLMIVKETEKGFFGRIRDVVSICQYDNGAHFLVYTPQELKDAAVVNTFVRNEILGKGKVVYRAAA